MTIACPAPDPELGVAVRIAGYLDCQARALGENGFQALTGGPVMASLLSGLVTIFVALIGYRLILGQTPGLRDGVGWAVRLGLVLALVTSWPAFQTLVFRVAADGPGELAALILPATGLPSEGLDVRVQQAYDTMRLGAGGQQAIDQAAQGASNTQQPGQAQPGQQPQSPPSGGLGYTPLPQTASLFVISTAGVTGAFRIAIGFLLAIAPIAILGLLFDATWGLFSGWVRALAGAALGLLAAVIVTALDLVMVESELANLQAYSAGGIARAVDPQGLTTIVLLFGVVMLVATLAAARVAGAFRLAAPGVLRQPFSYRQASTSIVEPIPTSQPNQVLGTAQGQAGLLAQSRTAAVADALAATVRREQVMVGGGGGTPDAPSRRVSIVEGARRTDPGGAASPLGAAGRRSTGRRTLSAQRRDRTG